MPRLLLQDTVLTERLEALRVWTQSNLAELRGRNGVGIHAKLRQLNSDEMSHYKFMYRYKERIAATPFLRTKLEAIDLMLQATVVEDVAAAAPSPEAVSVPDLAFRTSRPSRPSTSVPSVHVLFVRSRSSRPPTSVLSVHVWSVRPVSPRPSRPFVRPVCPVRPVRLSVHVWSVRPVRPRPSRPSTSRPRRPVCPVRPVRPTWRPVRPRLFTSVHVRPCTSVPSAPSVPSVPSPFLSPSPQTLQTQTLQTEILQTFQG